MVLFVSLILFNIINQNCTKPRGTDLFQDHTDHHTHPSRHMEMDLN